MENSTNYEEYLTNNNYNILVVEDDFLNQKIIQMNLEKKGFKVDIASNGQEGLNKYISNSYELIFMDIQMPVMDGIECTKEIRKFELQENKYTPIIAFTAYSTPEYKNAYAKAGMDDFMTKPIVSKVLDNLIEKHLRTEQV